MSRQQKSWMSNDFTWIRLIQWVKSNNIGIFGQSSTCNIPIVHKFVLQAILVIIKGTKGSHRLSGSIINSEEFIEAVFDQIISILIFAVAIVFHVLTNTELVINWRKLHVNQVIDAGWEEADSFFGIKVWETFTTNNSGKNVLMHVDKSVDACLTEFGDQAINLLEIVGIIDSFFTLNGFPHDAETHKVDSPRFQVLDVLIIEGILGIEVALRRDVRVHLINYVDAVENDSSATFVDKLSVCGVYHYFRKRRLHQHGSGSDRG